MESKTAADAINISDITADSVEPYVAQLARQLEAFSSITSVDDLSADEVADLALVMSNAAERLETEAGHIALLAQRRGVGKHLGSSSTGAWLAHRTRLTPAHAHRMIRRSETEHAFARFYQAHADGAITGYHLDHFGQLWRNHRSLEELLYRDEEMLCDAACQLSPAEFGLVCQKWLSLADPDGSYDKFLRNLERRFLAGSRDLDGNLHIAGQMDPITGEAFHTLLDRRVNELFEQDWAEATATAAEGETITKKVLRRNDAQRRMDALVSLVIDGSSTPEGAQRPEPMLHFGLDSVSFAQFLDAMLAEDLPDGACSTPDAPTLFDAEVDFDGEDLEDEGAGGRSSRPDGPSPESGSSAKNHPTLPATAAAFDPTRRCETGQGRPVPWRVMLQELLTVRVRRVVFGAPSVIIDAGETRRLFSPTQRELIKHRDRCCTFPGCHRDAAYCETDHILAAIDGGLTDLSNGQCLCRYHHRLKTKGRFTCERMPDGEVRFYLPTGVQIE